MTAAEQQRIDNLIELVTDVLDEPAEDPPEVAAWKQRFLSFSPAAQRRMLALMAMEDNLRMFRSGAKADAAANVEIDAARKWALDMGRAARKGK